MKESKRIRRIQSPIIPVIGDLIRKNPGTISLGQGVVNYGPPRGAIEGIERFLSNPANHRYQMVNGIPELIEPILLKLEEENRVVVDERRRVFVTAGGNMAFLNAVLAVADQGDEVIQLLPYYFNHEMAIRMAGATPVFTATGKGYQPGIDAIEEAITDRTRAVVTISPNNPTGAVYSEDVLDSINCLCAERDIYHIHDEAYEYFVYDDVRHYSPASSDKSVDHTISLFSLSKSYGFASWRIGWMVIPALLDESVRKIQDTNLICPPVVSQWAAAGALREGYDFCRGKIEAIRAVRSMALEKLSSISAFIDVEGAQGAFYLFLKVDTQKNDMDIVKYLIETQKVAVIPGSAFGVDQGCFLRVAYGSLSQDTVSEGLDRLVRGLTEYLS